MRVASLILVVLLLGGCSEPLSQRADSPVSMDPIGSNEDAADFDIETIKEALDSANSYQALGVSAFRFRSTLFARGEVDRAFQGRGGFVGEIRGATQDDPPARHLRIAYRGQRFEWLQVGRDRWVREEGEEWKAVDAFVSMELSPLFPFVDLGHAWLIATRELQRGESEVVEVGEVHGLPTVRLRVVHTSDSSVTTTNLWITTSGVLLALHQISQHLAYPDDGLQLEQTWDLYPPDEPFSIRPPLEPEASG